MDDKEVMQRPIKFYKWVVIWGIFVFILIVVSTMKVDLDEIQHRDEGMFAVETLYSSGEITGVGERYEFANRRRRKHYHNVSFFIDELQDYSGMRVPDDELENYEVGDKVTIIREVWYLKPGFRLFFQDSIVDVTEG